MITGSMCLIVGLHYLHQNGVVHGDLKSKNGIVVTTCTQFKVQVYLFITFDCLSVL